VKTGAWAPCLLSSHPFPGRADCREHRGSACCRARPLVSCPPRLRAEIYHCLWYCLNSVCHVASTLSLPLPLHQRGRTLCCDNGYGKALTAGHAAVRTWLWTEAAAFNGVCSLPPRARTCPVLRLVAAGGRCGWLVLLWKACWNGGWCTVPLMGSSAFYSPSSCSALHVRISATAGCSPSTLLPHLLVSTAWNYFLCFFFLLIVRVLLERAGEMRADGRDEAGRQLPLLLLRMRTWRFCNHFAVPLSPFSAYAWHLVSFVF